MNCPFQPYGTPCTKKECMAWVEDNRMCFDKNLNLKDPTEPHCKRLTTWEMK